MSWDWIFANLVVLVAAAAVGEAILKRQSARPLAHKFTRTAPEKKPLGLEATDLSMVEKAHALNESIEDRNSKAIMHGRWGSAGSFGTALRIISWVKHFGRSRK